MEDTKSSSLPVEPNIPTTPIVDNLIEVDTDATTTIASEPATPTNTPSLVIPASEIDNNNKVPTLERVESQKGSLPTISEVDALQTSDINKICDTEQCSKCNKLEYELNKIKAEKLDLDQTLSALGAKLQLTKDELEREVQRRVDLEQRFTEEAKRTTDQIEELISKSESDDARLNELRKRFELYSRETSSMIENFTTSREVLASQLLELRQENDYLLGKYLTKSRDLQSADIDLPQNVEELQFHCLTLHEKLILSTMAKERLEETLMQTNDQTSPRPNTTATSTSTP